MAEWVLSSGCGECTLTFSSAPEWLPADRGANERGLFWFSCLHSFGMLHGFLWFHCCGWVNAEPPACGAAPRCSIWVPPFCR